MKKLGIICTLGTTTDDEQVLKEMIKYGMKCARLNTAYATTEDYKKRIDQLRNIDKIPIMMDLKGPQIRISANCAYSIQKGDEIQIGFKEEPIRFNQNFYSDVKEGDEVLFENGTIKTVIKSKEKNDILRLEILDPGEGILHKQMGASIPNKYLNVPQLTEKDKQVINFSTKNNIEYIALSYVRDSKDILNLNDMIKQNGGKDIGIVAKIENELGIKNLKNIIKESYKNSIKLSVMVARGDLFVELPYQKLPLAQKEIIKTCNEYKIPVIVATGLLESMIKNNKPTRSEVSDIANAVYDGCDYLMLSAETSNGKHPALAVKNLHSIIEECYKEKNFFN